MARMTDAAIANVFVYAKGRNIFPSGPVNANTGMNDTTVLTTAVTMAPPTSVEAS
jgi:hypothetical protein